MEADEVRRNGASVRFVAAQKEGARQGSSRVASAFLASGGTGFIEPPRLREPKPSDWISRTALGAA